MIRPIYLDFIEMSSRNYVSWRTIFFINGSVVSYHEPKQ